MSFSYDISAALAGFRGHAPLFPLPNAALFPHLAQPLHIFETRYREMTADALEHEGLIALGVLKPDHEALYDSKEAPVFSSVCLGKITLHEETEDGRYNIVVHGLTRATILEERSSHSPYRDAILKIEQDIYPAATTHQRDQRRAEMVDALRQLFPALIEEVNLKTLLADEIPFGLLCDLTASALHLSPVLAADVLAEVDVDRRSEIVCRELRERMGKSRQPVPTIEFPPPFSVN